MLKPSEINVLIACEESQVECRAFRAEGFNAFSCDLQPPARGAQLSWQIQADVLPYLRGETTFTTMDGQLHSVPMWHLIIAHPPCTYICKLGSVHMMKNGVIDPHRLLLQTLAVRFFMECLNARAPFVCVENPLPQARANLPKPSFYVQPYWFGHPWSKKTLYWVRNLPPLLPTAIVSNWRQFVASRRGKYRSRSFEGIAAAMASQWGAVLLDF